MDGKKENIADHFKEIYEDLYNSVDDMNNIYFWVEGRNRKPD